MRNIRLKKNVRPKKKTPSTTFRDDPNLFFCQLSKYILITIYFAIVYKNNIVILLVTFI